MHSGINTIDLRKVSMEDLNHVGGKNACLGEMLGGLSGANICVLQATADAFRKFLAQNNLDKNINEILSGLDVRYFKSRSSSCC
jgi:pyruvate,water dikinase